MTLGQERNCSTCVCAVPSTAVSQAYLENIAASERKNKVGSVASVYQVCVMLADSTTNSYLFHCMQKVFRSSNKGENT